MKILSSTQLLNFKFQTQDGTISSDFNLIHKCNQRISRSVSIQRKYLNIWRQKMTHGCTYTQPWLININIWMNTQTFSQPTVCLISTWQIEIFKSSFHEKISMLGRLSRYICKNVWMIKIDTARLWHKLHALNKIYQLYGKWRKVFKCGKKHKGICY